MRKLLITTLAAVALTGCAHTGYVSPVVTGAVVGAGVGYVVSQSRPPVYVAPPPVYYPVVPKPIYAPPMIYAPPYPPVIVHPHYHHRYYR